MLAAHDAEFILVGGVAAVLQGAPISTFDLDVVHSRSTTSLDRLLAALETLEARYRDPAGRRRAPDKALLASDGHHLLMTRAGPLDVLGTIGQGSSYEDLLAHTIPMETDPGVRVRVLDLETLIETKQAAGRDKDLAVLAVLRRTLEERKKR